MNVNYPYVELVSVAPAYNMIHRGKTEVLWITWLTKNDKFISTKLFESENDAIDFAKVFNSKVHISRDSLYNS